ncbi:MAG: hypothetical protein QGI33_01800, partial [Candidatus Brocadiia bacterium]|nr:hypothetical protein [Candidatus Brocadiia bacterium]
GRNLDHWDGTDDAGRLVAPGSYRVRGLRRGELDVLYQFAYGAPGGLIPSRHGGSGQTTGWAGDVYGSYSASYPPTWVRRDLTTLLRARRPTPEMAGSYIDEYGMLRDPLVDYLAGRAFGGRSADGQLDYNRLDDESAVH